MLATGNVGDGCNIDSVKPTGYDFGVTCHLTSFATGKKWILTFDYVATSGKKITMHTRVSALNPADPVSANDTITRTVLAKQVRPTRTGGCVATRPRPTGGRSAGR